MSFIKKANYFFIVFVTSTSVSAAGFDKRAHLWDVYQQAVLNDAKLSAARHDYQALREAAPQSRAGLLPTLSAGGSMEPVRLTRDEPSSTRTRSQSVFQANLNQPLFRLDRWFQLEAAQSTTLDIFLMTKSKFATNTQ